jgi:hypothetical protein
MTRRIATVLFILSVLTLPIVAQPGQLQYFGYVGSGDDDLSLNVTQGFTNFAHVWARDSPTDPFVRDRVTAISQRGLKATVDLGRIFWCDYDHNQSFHYRCADWQTRWQQWKTFNASILSPDKILAFAVLDEPFNRGVDMTHYAEVVQTVKTDLSWAKIFLVEAACAVLGQCGFYPDAFYYYNGTLPGVDWVGLAFYGQYPNYNSVFLDARAQFKSRFPGKKWLYVMDGYWDPDLHPQFLYMNQLDSLAWSWYQMASSDPDAVLLGVFYWGMPSYGLSSRQFDCSLLSHHVAIGREITGKTRPATALPVGILMYAPRGAAIGWACDPDGTLCERPRIDLYVNGAFAGQGSYEPGWESSIQQDSRCGGTGISTRFGKVLNSGTSGSLVTAVAQDLDSGRVTLPSACPQNPACVW